MPKIPRSSDNDYTQEMSRTRREFIARETGTQLNHLGHYSIPPESLSGNIENFAGVAQVPIGFAGPMLVNGELPQCGGDGQSAQSITEQNYINR